MSVNMLGPFLRAKRNVSNCHRKSSVLLGLFSHLFHKHFFLLEKKGVDIFIQTLMMRVCGGKTDKEETQSHDGSS